jgi:hypothetical protein
VNVSAESGTKDRESVIKKEKDGHRTHPSLVDETAFKEAIEGLLSEKER